MAEQKTLFLDDTLLPPYFETGKQATGKEANRQTGNMQTGNRQTVKQGNGPQILVRLLSW